jgi:hypothetical protein
MFLFHKCGFRMVANLMFYSAQKYNYNEMPHILTPINKIGIHYPVLSGVSSPQHYARQPIWCYR